MISAPDAGSSERFGYEWSVYADLLPAHEEQFLRWTEALPRVAWQGAHFLDVGCGMGRNSFWACRSGAVGGAAIDIDDRTLASARRTLAGLPVQVRKESAYAIAGDAEFDVTFSIGVVHHLAEPAKALREMVRMTKPGGRVLIWVYGRENNAWLVRVMNPLRRRVFSRLPPAFPHLLSFGPAVVLWALLRLGFGRLEYLRLARTFSFAHLRSIVFDQMLPRIAHYWTGAEAATMMREAGLSDVRAVWVNEVSWSVVGVKRE